MPERTKRFLAVGLVGVLVMVVAGVFAAAKPATPHSSPTDTPTSPPPATMVVAQTPAPPTDTPFYISTATPARDFDIASIAHSATLAPAQIIFTPVPTYPLTIRQPSIAELENYLVTNKVGVYDCPSCWASAVVPSLSAQAERMYVDLNGDQQDDLVISDRVFSPITGYQGFVIMLLWQGDRHAEPFVVLDLSEYISPNQRVLLEDLTGDQIPELIIDQASHHGGAGIYFVYWMRYLVQCKVRCKIVWSGVMNDLDEFVTSRVFKLAEFQTYLDNEGGPSFTITRQGYSLPSPPFAIYHTAVNAQTIEIWQWNGETFLMTEKFTSAEEYSIYYQPKLTATSQSGNQATVSISSEDREKGRSNCTLSINGKAMWQSFTCYQSLEWVTWQDVNHDGREDVVITYHAPFAELGVLVYEWDSVDVHLIADVKGKIIQSDLYGVRLENIDDDNALEILAGNYELAGSNCKIADLPFLGPTEDCWYAELNFYDTVYDWNGATYVDRGRIP